MLFGLFGMCGSNEVYGSYFLPLLFILLFFIKIVFMNASHLLVKRTEKFFQNFKKAGTEHCKA
jgi:hypothetical protein